MLTFKLIRASCPELFPLIPVWLTFAVEKTHPREFVHMLECLLHQYYQALLAVGKMNFNNNTNRNDGLHFDHDNKQEKHNFDVR